VAVDSIHSERCGAGPFFGKTMNYGFEPFFVDRLLVRNVRFHGSAAFDDQVVDRGMKGAMIVFKNGDKGGIFRAALFGDWSLDMKGREKMTTTSGYPAGA
jgi:hypothetical protein